MENLTRFVRSELLNAEMIRIKLAMKHPRKYFLYTTQMIYSLIVKLHAQTSHESPHSVLIL
jgi:hypothetical protein